MVHRRNVSLAVSLVLLGACSGRTDRAAPLSDDLKRDLAAASSGGDLAPAPQSFQPMRFVSSVERSPIAAPAKRVAVAHHPIKARHSRQPAPEVASETPDPTSTEIGEAPAPVYTPEAPTSAPVVVAEQPTNAPANIPASSGSGGDVGAGSRGNGGGWGGILGGLMGAVIRGGVGTVDKCDPRTDGHGQARPPMESPPISDRPTSIIRPPVIDRPEPSTPVWSGRPSFPRSPRH